MSNSHEQPNLASDNEDPDGWATWAIGIKGYPLIVSFPQIGHNFVLPGPCGLGAHCLSEDCPVLATGTLSEFWLNRCSTTRIGNN